MAHFRNFTKSELKYFRGLSEEEKVVFLYDNILHSSFYEQAEKEETEEEFIDDNFVTVDVKKQYLLTFDYLIDRDLDLVCINYEEDSSLQEVLQIFSMNGNILFRRRDLPEVEQRFKKIYSKVRVYERVAQVSYIGVN